MDTRHYSADKNTQVRREIIEKYIGWGEDIFSAEIDRKHKNGTEIHVVTDSGIIKIYNARTRMHVTDLIARPNQIIRVYRARGQYAPNWLLDIAYENQNRGFNLV
jgi:hypothetical protein